MVTTRAFANFCTVGYEVHWPGPAKIQPIRTRLRQECGLAEIGWTKANDEWLCVSQTKIISLHKLCRKTDVLVEAEKTFCKVLYGLINENEAPKSSKTDLEERSLTRRLAGKMPQNGGSDQLSTWNGASHRWSLLLLLFSIVLQVSVIFPQYVFSSLWPVMGKVCGDSRNSETEWKCELARWCQWWFWQPVSAWEPSAYRVVPAPVPRWTAVVVKCSMETKGTFPMDPSIISPTLTASGSLKVRRILYKVRFIIFTNDLQILWNDANSGMGNWVLVTDDVQGGHRIQLSQS